MQILVEIMLTDEQLWEPSSGNLEQELNAAQFQILMGSGPLDELQIRQLLEAQPPEVQLRILFALMIYGKLPAELMPMPSEEWVRVVEGTRAARRQRVFKATWAGIQHLKGEQDIDSWIALLQHLRNTMG